MYEKCHNRVSSILSFYLLDKLVHRYTLSSVSVVLYYFGIVSYAVMIAYFVYFVYSSYLDAIGQAYIALDEGNGDCSTVAISVTGSYIADAQGWWIGSPEFQYSSGKYYINMNSFKASYDQYQAMMETYQQVLDSVGAESKRENLPINLARWSSFIKYYSVENPEATNFTTIGYGQLQSLQMAGDPTEIFSLSYQQLVFGGAKGYCPVTGYADYDKANGLMYSTIIYDNFVNNSICLDIAIPKSLGYSSALDLGVFKVSLEVRAYLTAFAVNYGILPITSLYRAGGFRKDLVVGNETYVIGQYFDLRYPTMNPIFCMYNNTPVQQGSVTSLCFYLLGTTVTLPVFNHFGVSIVEPVYCDCYNGIGGEGVCQKFDLMTALLFYKIVINPNAPQGSIVAQIANLVKVVLKNNGYPNLNRAAYNASWGAAAIAYGSVSPSEKTASWYSDAFDFCNIGGGITCSLAVFHASDNLNQLVSTYKYQLSNGSCTDSFTIPPDDW